MIKPLFTEKSMNLAKIGKYTFFVDMVSDKSALKSEISKLFGVTVLTIKSIVVKGETKRNASGRRVIVKPIKKVIVTLKEGEKIDAFEEGKKWKD